MKISKKIGRTRLRQRQQRENRRKSEALGKGRLGTSRCTRSFISRAHLIDQIIHSSSLCAIFLIFSMKSRRGAQFWRRNTSPRIRQEIVSYLDKCDKFWNSFRTEAALMISAKAALVVMQISYKNPPSISLTFDVVTTSFAIDRLRPLKAHLGMRFISCSASGRKNYHPFVIPSPTNLT